MIIKKDVLITLKVTKEEKQKIQELADKKNMSVSEYIRKKCLKK